MKKWLDGWLMAGQGVWLSMKDWRFWVAFLPVFLVFGTLLNLLANGLGIFQAIGAVGFSGAMRIIFDAMVSLFGINKAFLDWILAFSIAILQGILVGLIVVVWRKKSKIQSGSLQNAGIVAGLAVLGTGCPTCGTALLAPAIGAVFAGGGVLVGAISWVVTLAAVTVALLSLRKVGMDAYAIIMSEKYETKKAKRNNEKGR